ncbi:PREDICTED: uncharacterized protein LOC105571129 [Vollenhovia emeryi]|uniref:uncharacterized protein LOC105571129 n=1 Tax=Vollenhovia emeryi TaxID=411798 RepID=UPI0005F4C3DB|nr:PREDICTED: uncharacterized protein LOC105571129 [Vollenhovia emeryi]
MYRQIWIDSRDRDYQRILWGNDSDELQEYQLLTVTYGTTAAPFLALRVLKQLICDEGGSFPLAAQILQSDVYVDDVLFGAEDVPLLRRSREQVCALLAKGGFTLRKWASNRSSLLADISEEDHGLACNRELKLDDNLNILGISWAPALDSFQFRVSPLEATPRTKRTILSAIAKLFDPLGWVTPVTITAKIFMQSLWRLQIQWDDTVPVLALNKWEDIYRNLSHLNGLQIDRWTGRGADTAEVQLHGFADASTVAYAAVVYSRVVSIAGEITVRLLIAKSKVAPLKTVSVPRLELSAATLLTRILEFIQESLHISSVKSYCWTDSTVALAWIQSHPSRWKTFVSNRVAEIQTRAQNAQWRYVSTHENPADCASRGLLGHELPSFGLWWQGPSWLHLNPDEWPSQSPEPMTHVSDEAKPTTSHCAKLNETWELASRYSSWTKLLRVTAYIQRFVNNCRKHDKQFNIYPARSKALTSIEITHAQRFWIQQIQADRFPLEIAKLKLGQAPAAKSEICSLSPFLDSDSVIRVGGRLLHAPVAYEKKHPALLGAHLVVDLIVRYTHLKHCHAGLQLTLAALRQEYWILRARQIVKRIIFQCATCTRERAAVPEQLMGQLPAARVSAPPRAFSHCGLDYAGPIAIRTSSGRGHKSHKGYISLFVCLASRAIHLELVTSYSTSSFLDAFSRFCARRGLPSVVYSDNGTTFTGADRELQQAYNHAIRNPDFLNQTAADKIKWEFIPPHAPHFGGLWEAGVRSVKYHLRRVLGAHTLTFEELSTLLCRIEACLNSRPIGPLTDTIDDFAPLTPGHLLIGSAITVNPEPSVLAIAENRLSRWQLVRQIAERFWRLWQSDYINTLQQRGKWRTERESIKVGTMVLLRNALLPPCKWELGRVTKIFKGPDGLVRVVSVRTAQSEFKRPIVKLCVLPIETCDPASEDSELRRDEQTSDMKTPPVQ